MKNRSTRTGTRWNRNTRLVMFAGLFLVFGSIAQLAYRYTLPTAGWSMFTTDLEDSNFYFSNNLIGAESGLKENDQLLEVDGVDVRGSTALRYHAPPPGWQAGNQVDALILRCEPPLAHSAACEELTIPIPVLHWTPASLVRSISWESGPAELIAMILLMAIGWFTFLVRPEEPSARALMIFCSAFASAVLSSLLPVGADILFNLPALLLAGFFGFIIFGAVLTPALFTFSLLFPKPKRFISRRPFLAAIPHLLGVLLVIAYIFNAPTATGWISSMIMIALSIVSLVHAGLTQRDPVSRAQIRWALAGFISGLLLFSLNFPLGFGWVTDPFLLGVLDFLQSLGLVMIGGGLAVAILRYRLYDIDVIIRRTLQYSILTALLAMLFFGGVVLLQAVFQSLSGNQDSPLVTVLSTLAIAAVFNPLRRRVQEFVDRRFYRSKYNAEQTLARFSAAARSQVDVDRLSASLMAAVEESIQPDKINLWILEK